MAIVGIIPARYGSKRPPGKPLSDIHGKTLIGGLHALPCAARSLDRVMVAADDERIGTAARSLLLDARAEEPGPLHELHQGRPTRVGNGVGGLAVHTPESLERVRQLLAPGKGRLA